MRKWASKERGLRYYGEGKDIQGKPFHVQDGSWACFSGVRIYGHDSSNEQQEICLSLKVTDAKKLMKGLQQFIKKHKNG